MSSIVRFPGPRPSRSPRGRSLFFMVALAGLCLAAASQWKNPAQAGRAPSEERGSDATLVGRASVVDGDTIRIGGRSVRLAGVDAPESRQNCADAQGARYACGRVAADALDDYLAASRPTRCEVLDTDRYGRAVGRCRRADGADVSAWLVRNGHAVDWPRYSGGRFASDQDAARERRLGVWQGAFEMPWDWRRAHATN